MSTQETFEAVDGLLNTAAVGAIIGACITWIATRKTIAAQQETWIAEHRTAAYQAFLTAIAEMRSNEDASNDAGHKVQVALAQVRMHGTPAVVKSATVLFKAMAELLFPNESDYADPRKFVFLREHEFLNTVRAELGQAPIAMSQEYADKATVPRVVAIVNPAGEP